MRQDKTRTRKGIMEQTKRAPRLFLYYIVFIVHYCDIDEQRPLDIMLYCRVQVSYSALLSLDVRGPQ